MEAPAGPVGTVRIVGGALRGRKLRVPDAGVRPTSERVREAVFDILGPRVVQGAAVLDLYAGTGAYGMEALSRGAVRVELVEGDAATAAAIQTGLKGLGLADVARVHVADLGRGVLPTEVRGPFHLVFLDPPYETGAGELWLATLGRGEVLEAGGVLVYERRRGSAPLVPDSLRLATERRYGDTTIAIYLRTEGSGDSGGSGAGDGPLTEGGT